MKQSHALAYLRQLCCLGLNKELVMREFLVSVQAAIPSCYNTYTGLDEQYMPTDCIVEFVIPELIERSSIVACNYFTPDWRRRAAAWFGRHTLLTDYAVLDENFYKSDLYNLMWRTADIHHCLDALILRHGKPVGIFSLHRSCAQKPFNKDEQNFFLRLLPYVSHALSARSSADFRYGENGPSGMMILDAQGTILYLCATAKRLLALAQHPMLFRDAQKKEAALLPQLAQLCRNLEAIFQGRDAAPPSLCYTNSQGRFLFRAYWLNQQNNEAGGLIGMTVEHQEPLALKILRGMKTLPLSPTQKEVALLLAQGVSAENIGQRLHVKPTTVKDHVGKIYLKLDIHQREELLPKLLAGGN